MLHISLIRANPALGKDGREEAMGTGEESSKPVYSLARPICEVDKMGISRGL